MADIYVAPLFSSAGEPLGEVDLEPSVFGVEPNLSLMHQVVTAQLAGARTGTASTKTRAEVRGGGKKPWRQKGLGRARHGSSRSPIWKGGGVSFGPRPRNFVQRTNQKMKAGALRSALSVRASQGRIKVIDGFDWELPATQKAAALLSAIGEVEKTLVVLAQSDEVAGRSFRNLDRVRLAAGGRPSTYDVLWADGVVFTNATLPTGATFPQVAEEEEGTP